jgi:hypothetical protein
MKDYGEYLSYYGHQHRILGLGAKGYEISRDAQSPQACIRPNIEFQGDLQLDQGSEQSYTRKLKGTTGKIICKLGMDPEFNVQRR